MKNKLEKVKKYIAKQELKKARDMIQSFIKEKGTNDEVRLELGKINYLQGNYREAVNLLAPISESSKQYYNGKMLSAKALKEIGDYYESIIVLSRLYKIFRDKKDSLEKEIKNVYPLVVDNIKKLNIEGRYKKAAFKAEKVLDEIKPGSKFLYNKILNEIEIARGDTVLESKMRSLVVTLTTACNLKCTMCDWIKHDYWELPQKILKEIKSFFPYLQRIVWQGGEVFLYSGLKNLIKEAGNYPNIKQIITTNGLLIDKNWADTLVNAGVDVTFSIDGFTKKVYEGIRKGGDFERLLENVENFNKIKKEKNSYLNLNLHMVVMRSNYRQMEKCVDFAIEKGFTIVVFLPMGGNSGSPENIFHPEDLNARKFMEDIIPKLLEKAKANSLMIENRLPVQVPSGDEVEISDEEKKEPVRVCHLPWMGLYVDYDGTVRPDCLCCREKYLGHAERNFLSEIWNNEKMQAYRQKLAQGREKSICNLRCIKGKVSDRYLKLY